MIDPSKKIIIVLVSGASQKSLNKILLFAESYGWKQAGKNRHGNQLEFGKLLNDPNGMLVFNLSLDHSKSSEALQIGEYWGLSYKRYAKSENEIYFNLAEKPAYIAIEQAEEYLSELENMKKIEDI